MAAEKATILIPDISGYTEFVSRTELDHSSHILNHLLENIVGSVSEDFIVSEIEGDAVLLYRKGDPPSKRALVEQCRKTFLAFHREVLEIQSRSICQCGACQGVLGLSLKFVVHFGAISEIRVARFVKASGLAMVIAHRLLKNDIEGGEYLLLSRGYLDQVSDRDDASLRWQAAQASYPSIGAVPFEFAPLDALKSELPEVQRADGERVDDDSQASEITIDAGFRKVLAVLIDLDQRPLYVAGVNRVEGGADPLPSIGNKHNCVFDDFKVEIEPMRLEVRDDGAEYFEYDRCAPLALNAVYHFSLDALGADRCRFSVQIHPEPGFAIAPQTRDFLLQSFETTKLKLKSLVESAPAD